MHTPCLPLPRTPREDGVRHLNSERETLGDFHGMSGKCGNMLRSQGILMDFAVFLTKKMGINDLLGVE
jgi:hypothetical protein